MASVAFAAQLLASSFTVTARRWSRGPSRPSWSWGFEVVAHALRRRASAIARLSWPEQRAAWASMTGPAPILRRVRRERFELAGLAAEAIEPREGAIEIDLLYLHGGSFIYGSIDTHRELVARLALACRARAVAIEYRLAPEHPYPAALEDALAAHAALRGARPLLVAGDSAGGNLALCTLLALRDRGEALPEGAILVSPWVDLAARGGTLEAHSAFDYAEPSDFVAWSNAYRGTVDERDPRVSPLHADLSGLPPLLVTVGTAEMLYDQVTSFVAKARAAGTRVELEEMHDLFHNGPVFAGLFASCRPVFDRMGAFAREVARRAA